MKNEKIEYEPYPYQGTLIAQCERAIIIKKIIADRKNKEM